jgi:plastocyanin
MAPIRRWLAVAAAGLLVTAAVQAAEPEVMLVIKNHRFEPAELKVPAGQKVKLVVHNQDATPEEFESHSLNREKVIPGGQKATIFIGPLKPGRYGFFGEYNEKTAQGTVVAE